MVRSTLTQSSLSYLRRAAARPLTLALVAALSLPAAVAAQGAKPQTVTVKTGDTLWGLARQYLGDPFLWPDIYRLNTQVVEDPHWIYPGEVLRLISSDAVSAVPTTDTPPVQPDTTLVAVRQPDQVAAPVAADTDATDMSALFSQSRRNSVMRETLRAYSDQPYRPLRRSEFYSSGFLTEGHDLPYGRLTGRVTPQQISVISDRVSGLLYTEMTVTPPSGATYQVGDSLLILARGDAINGFGDILMPTGLARVLDVRAGQYVVSIVAVYGAVRNGQLVLPAEHFNDAGSARAVAIADGVQVRLLGSPIPRPLKKPQDVLFIDKGRKDGVAPGDIFELRRTEKVSGEHVVPEVIATLQVVHVGERTATTRIIAVTSPNLRPGTEGRQIAKLPS
ncbi:MAG: LysM peptidoglycan-binding domain-containing protein [Bacillota bacterium]|jgi:LysM repeat protein